MDDRGQATPLLALLVLAVGGLIVGLARFGVDLTHAARATAAADAAALAGAAEGTGAAEDLAARNGGEVLSIEHDGHDVEVRVRVGDTWTVARAERAGGRDGVRTWVSPDGAGGAGLAPGLRRRLGVAARLLRQPVPVVEASGRTAAVPAAFVARLVGVAGRAGLCRPAPRTDPVRFASCPGPAT